MRLCVLVSGLAARSSLDDTCAFGTPSISIYSFRSVIEESTIDAKNNDIASPAEPSGSEENPSLLEQMGGLSGLVSSTVPILAFVPANRVWGLTGAIVASLGLAFAIFLWRLARKENIQPAISGLLGVAICVVIAWWTGDAKGYFLYGIWMSLLYAVVFLISIPLRWPLVGVIWKGINGDGMAWRTVAGARRAYAWATAGWALVFAARFVIQNWLYNVDDTTALWIARMLMGWPLTGLVTLFTVVMVKKATSALQEAGMGLSEAAQGAIDTNVAVSEPVDKASTQSESP